MSTSIMFLDNNPLSRSEINDHISAIGHNDTLEISVHNADNFRDAITTINQYKIDLVIINILSIDIDKYIDDCIQLRNVYSFSPIIGITKSDKILPLDKYSYIGFDDILDINIITPDILYRVFNAAIQRSKNYHLFHTTNQRQLISSRLLKLLLDKKMWLASQSQQFKLFIPKGLVQNTAQPVFIQFKMIR